MKNNTKKTIKIYLESLSKYKVSVFAMIISVIGATVSFVIVPLYFKEFFDVLTGDQARDDVVRSLIDILIIIAGLNLLSWLFWRIATFTASYFYPKVMADLTNRCFAYLHKNSFSFFENTFVGSLTKRVKWFVNSFDSILDRITWNFLPLLINIIIITVVLSQRSFYLAFGIVGWIILFMIVTVAFTRYKLKYDIQRSEAETRESGVLADTITNQTNVKLFNGYKNELKGFSKVVEDVRKLRKFTWDLSNIFDAVQGFLMVALEVGILYLAIKLWQKGVLTVGDFVLIQAYLMRIFMHIWDFGRLIRQVYENLADAEEMTVILNTPHEINDVRGAKNLKVERGEVDFKDVVFHYRKTRKIINSFNLKIKSGERIALIGPSGAGKTTIVKLLLRQHDITSGKVLIDGQNISKVTQESLWKNVSLVPQDPILFHRTLMENIRYGKSGATNEEVTKAARAANCHDFINGLSDGYDTYVGERGIKLSGGERQRVAIARAILRNAPILVLDEATSSLDSESESLIQDALDKLMKDKTVIVIAHRLSTIRKVDRIIVVDEGGIIEEGTHDKLIKKKDGIYGKLWKLQAGGFIQ